MLLSGGSRSQHVFGMVPRATAKQRSLELYKLQLPPAETTARQNLCDALCPQDSWEKTEPTPMFNVHALKSNPQMPTGFFIPPSLLTQCSRAPDPVRHPSSPCRSIPPSVVPSLHPTSILRSKSNGMVPQMVLAAIECFPRPQWSVVHSPLLCTESL